MAAIKNSIDIQLKELTKSVNLLTKMISSSYGTANSTIEDDIEIIITNGGNREVAYKSREFYQMIYDDVKKLKNELESVIASHLNTDEKIKEMESSLSKILISIHNIEANMPEKVEKKLEKINFRSNLIITFVKNLGGFMIVIYFVIEFLVKLGLIKL
jgi:K+/H+ antiporter YhaU regulatory subunit KhtT